MMANQYFMNGVAFTNYFFTSTALVFFIHAFTHIGQSILFRYSIVLFKRASLLSMDKMDR